MKQVKEGFSSYNIKSQKQFEKTGYIQQKKQEDLENGREKQFELELRLLKKSNEHYLNEIDAIQILSSSTLLSQEKEQLKIYIDELFEYKYEFFEVNKQLVSTASMTERGDIISSRKKQDMSTRQRMSQLEDLIKRGKKQLIQKCEAAAATVTANIGGSASASQEL